jgi:hypothetical protein
MNLVAWTFQLRWILYLPGLCFLFAWALSFRRGFFEKVGEETFLRIENALSGRFKSILLAISGLFFAASLSAKILQYRALEMNGQDFWLFRDLLEQATKGGWEVTRFAPQAWGWVQHGAVHGFLSFFAVALPFSFAFGSTAACLIYHPLCLSVAGYFLGRLTWKLSPLKTRATLSIGVVLSFLASYSVGKILMYEVHPESLYVACFFVAAFGFTDLRPGKATLAVIACALGGLLKEDALLVFGPWILVLMGMEWKTRSRNLLWIGAGFGALLTGYFIQLFVVHEFNSGNLGPRAWLGTAVTIPVGPGVFGGDHIDSVLSAFRVFLNLAKNQSATQRVVGFLVSRQWLSLLIIAPWVVRSRFFWAITLPLAAAMGLVDGPSKLWLYYSAPLLGPLWVSISRLSHSGAFERDARRLLWLMSMCFLLAGGGIEFKIPSSGAAKIRAEAEAFAPCLETLPKGGWVAAPLLPFVPDDSVISERLPKTLESISFAFLTPSLGIYELSSAEQKHWVRGAADSHLWRRVGADCGPTTENSSVELWVKNQ